MSQVRAEGCFDGNLSPGGNMTGSIEYLDHSINYMKYILSDIVDAIECNPAIGLQSIFIIKQDYLGTVPNWLKNGDVMFLIGNATTLYIFAHMDDVSRGRAHRLREQLRTRKNRDGSRKLSDAQIRALEQEAQEVESKAGSRYEWQLVGEAFVEGSINGEVAGQAKRLA
jgi:hypothetical protein